MRKTQKERGRKINIFHHFYSILTFRNLIKTSHEIEVSQWSWSGSQIPTTLSRTILRHKSNSLTRSHIRGSRARTHASSTHTRKYHNSRKIIRKKKDKWTDRAQSRYSYPHHLHTCFSPFHLSLSQESAKKKERSYLP